MNLKELIDRIRIRPGMYVGKYDLNCLELFIGGFVFCLQANEIENKFSMVYRNYFNFYVQRKVLEKVKEELKNKLRYNNAMSFVQLIPFAESDPKKQFDFYFKCFDEFKILFDENYDFESLKKQFM